MDAPDFLSRLQIELRGSHTGSFRDGVLLPADSPGLPPPPKLVESLALNIFDWINRRAYSSNSQINAVEHSLLGHRYLLDMAAPGDVEFYILNYPGWTASINGLSQSIQSSPQGLVMITLPRASGELSITFQGTPIRSTSWVFTFLGVVAVVAIWRQQLPEPEEPRRSFLSKAEAIGLGLAFLGYALIVVVARG